ncbi:MAG: TlpA family protein disulfide reductase [Proteobacteria bacterium]|nr:TlpA family protein disulfide reductase [Pseudomonadota bacterium]MCP4916139.1 TlpA family protein disulfide reductase [Pseudomonadota bacterium]
MMFSTLMVSHALAGTELELPAFELQTTTGAQLSSSELQGKATLLNFWASWCAPCLAELPLLMELDQRLEGTEAQVLTINIDSRRPKVDATMKRLDLALLVALDPKGDVVAAFDPPAMPTSYLIDTNAQVVEVFRGALDDEQLQELELRMRKLVE